MVVGGVRVNFCGQSNINIHFNYHISGFNGRFFPISPPSIGDNRIKINMTPSFEVDRFLTV